MNASFKMGIFAISNQTSWWYGYSDHNIRKSMISQTSYF